MSVQPRMERLLGVDRKCFDVAIDHGIFNTQGFLSGIEDMESAVATILEAAPDAVQLAPGQAHLLQNVPGRHKPSLVYRVDVANVYGPNPPAELFCTLMESPVERAVRTDAAYVVIFLLLIPGETDLHRQCVENLIRIQPECEALGMPLMVEPIAMRPDGQGGFAVDGDVGVVKTLVRQAVELGADLIKADPTDDPDEYPQVIEAAGRCPVLVRGGGKASEEEIFQRTVDLMGAGASGIVYGRNVIQHDNPSGITRAFMEIVHGGASASDAMSILYDLPGSQD